MGKHKTQHATIIGGGKPARTGRVCTKCASRGELIVACLVAPIVSTEKAEKKWTGDVLKPFVKKLEGLARGYKATGQEERGSIYEDIAVMLDEARV
jgi:hypothetical protein